MSKDELKTFFEYSEFGNETEHYAKDLFLFSYLCNGMNMNDIFRLKFRNLDNNRLIFTRTKTRNTKKTDVKPIVVYLSETALDILKRRQNAKQTLDNYIFPLVNDSDTPKKQRADISQRVKQINKYVKRIAEKLGIEKEVTTYFARHTFATMLRNANVPNSFISESLGHSSIKTTEIYFDSFDTDFAKTYIEHLTDFKKS